MEFPEVGPEPIVIGTNIGTHATETDEEVGRLRLRALKPFALARLGRAYQVWDKTQNAVVSRDRQIPLRPYVDQLARRLACGTDLIFKWVALLCEKGPENVKAGELLKQAPTGGRGTSRLDASVERFLQSAAYKVCVTQGIRPGSKAANKKIRAELLAVGVMQPVCTATIAARSRSDLISKARADAYERDHLHRLAGQPDPTYGLNNLVVMDATQFTSDDRCLRIVDSHGRDLGFANVIFCLLSANRGVWSALGFVGAANSFLAGLAIKRGLTSKAPLLQQYGIDGYWLHHGHVGQVRHDGGSEFIGKQLKKTMLARDIAVDDRSPSATPHFRGGLERFNRTAHVMFDAFLESDIGKKFLRPVVGRPQDKGITLRDLDRALIEWLVREYQHRAHAGLGGDTPWNRMEKMINGECNFPASGLPSAVPESKELDWDFLWEDSRTVNQLGISFENRRYWHAELSRLFQLNRRSSKRKIDFRYHPYGMSKIVVKIPQADGSLAITDVNWLPENEKYRPTPEQAEASINPSFWEWRVLFKIIRAGNIQKATAGLAEALHERRERESAAGRQAGAPTKREKKSDSRNREMRQHFGETNAPRSDSDAQPLLESKRKRNVTPCLLPTGGGPEAY